MTAFTNPANSNEAEWEGLERVWPSIQQFPPRNDRSSWWLVLIGAALVVLAIGVLK